jgi:hypothetical protein
MIEDGVEQLKIDAATPEEYEQAEINLRRFVLMEIVEARRQNPQFPRIGEGVFGYIYNLICPLYPFC